MKKILASLGVIAFIVIIYFITSGNLTKAPVISDAKQSAFVEADLMNGLTFSHPDTLKIFMMKDPALNDYIVKEGWRSTTLTVDQSFEKAVNFFEDFKSYPGFFIVDSQVLNKFGTRVAIISSNMERDPETLHFYSIIFDDKNMQSKNYSFKFEIKCLVKSSSFFKTEGDKYFTCDQVKEMAQSISESLYIYDTKSINDYVEELIAGNNLELEQAKQRSLEATEKARNLSEKNEILN
jgi:hypothetical protein